MELMMLRVQDNAKLIVRVGQAALEEIVGMMRWIAERHAMTATKTMEMDAALRARLNRGGRA